MTEFLIYQGKTAIALAVFYIFYRLLLSKETFHRFNRIVLLGTAALSFILPLCVITINKVVTLPYASVSLEMPESIAETVTATADAAPEPIWPAVLCGIYILGAVAVLLMTVISIFKVRAIIRNGEHKTLESGKILVITDEDTSPFSWMKYIVLSREDYENHHTQILTHEKAHIALRHSWDLLFVDLITTIQWFNPAIWMLKSDLRALHEFEADDAVLRSGANIKEYQYLLIRKAVGKSGYSVANSLNHSTLKQRITMMLNKKSSRMSAWKALYVIPLVGISLAATAETKVDYRYEDREPETVADTLKARILKINDTADGKDSENWHKVSSGEPSSFRKKNLHEGKIITDFENRTLTVIYYDNNEKECQVQCTGIALDQDIYIHNGAIVTKGMADRAAEDPEAVMMTSYLKDGKKVMAFVTPSGTYMTGKVQILDQTINVVEVNRSNSVIILNGERMPEGFDLKTIDPETIASMEVLKPEQALKEYDTEKGVIVVTTDPEKKEEKQKKTKEPVPFQFLGQQPGFNGGNANEFSKWVGQNLRYPEKCRQSKVQGRVTLQFTITEEGKVSDVRVLRGVNEELDKEAVRVVSGSPLWTPGKDKNGETVPVSFTFPVIFQLPTSEDVEESSHYLEADVKPTFNGGDANEFARWVYSQIQYPEECRKAGIAGRVSVSFTVGTDGRLTEIQILRGVHEKLDAEALRVIGMSPEWTPGTKDGKPVPVRFVFPVTFEIPQDNV